MKHSILTENQGKRLDLPFWMLICFSMFCVWQMGFVYFVGPSLVLDSRTPLPIDMDNATMLIAVSYVLSIVFMAVLPHWVIWAERISALTALVSVLGLFLPLGEDVLRLLIYVQTFCCCFMIGFETFTIVNYFSSQSAIRHLTVAYGTACALIAAVQNDFVPSTYSAFRLLTVVMLVMMLVFFFRMPAGRAACPVYVKKNTGITPPRALMIGTFVLVFAGSVMAVSGPAISGEVEHGVFITYCVDAAASFLIYILHRRANIHPFRSVSVCIALGCIGFLLMYVSVYNPALSYVACGLIGFGMVPCQMLPLYVLALMRSYPSRFLSPITIGLALVAVLVQSSMVEIFRTAPNMLDLTYAVIMVFLAVLFLQIAPYLANAFRRRYLDEYGPAGAALADETASDPTDPRLEQLTAREREVLDLIGCGYSNRDIAKILFISEHTVNDYTKRIYRKLDVHSRHAAAQIVNRYALPVRQDSEKV